MDSISLKQARRLHLWRQGLLHKSPFAKSESGIVPAVTRLRYVQLDTISVVARAHHHILWNRVPDYSIAAFENVSHHKAGLFEYWGHAAAFLPMQDYRFSLARKALLRNGKKHWFERDLKLMDQLLEIIRKEGPKQSRDFNTPPGLKTGTWYDWKPTKKALEQLFMEGRLMIRARQGFQKIYDLPERVLPADLDISSPGDKELGTHLILRSIDSWGLTTLKQISYQQSFAKKGIQLAISELIEKGQVVKVQLKKQPDQVWFTKPDFLEKSVRISRKRLHLLSPFDPVVIQRERLADLFNFQYRLECYVPKHKRVFGYFTMPILWGDEFVGRLDAKADRKSGTFHVHQLWLEAEGSPPSVWLAPLAKELIQYARFCKTAEVQVHACTNSLVLRELRNLLKPASE